MAGLHESADTAGRIELWHKYLYTLREATFGESPLKPMYIASGLFLSADDDKLAAHMISTVTSDIIDGQVRGGVARRCGCAPFWSISRSLSLLYNKRQPRGRLGCDS